MSEPTVTNIARDGYTRLRIDMSDGSVITVEAPQPPDAGGLTLAIREGDKRAVIDQAVRTTGSRIINTQPPASDIRGLAEREQNG